MRKSFIYITNFSFVCCPFNYSLSKDNSNQMSKICPTCTSVCDLCQNGLYWKQDSRFGLYDVDLIQGTSTFDYTHTHKQTSIIFHVIFVAEFCQYLLAFPKYSESHL